MSSIYKCCFFITNIQKAFQNTTNRKVISTTSAAQACPFRPSNLPVSITFQFSCPCLGIFSAHAPTKVVNSKQRFSSIHDRASPYIGAPPWLPPPVAQYSMFIHSGTLYLKPLANCCISALDLVDCQSTSSAWWEGWESNPLTQGERFYRPPRLSDFAALPYGTPQGLGPIPLVLETNVLPNKLSVYVVVLLTLRRTPLVKTGARLCKDISDRPHQITNFAILL